MIAVARVYMWDSRDLKEEEVKCGPGGQGDDVINKDAITTSGSAIHKAVVM